MHFIVLKCLDLYYIYCCVEKPTSLREITVVSFGRLLVLSDREVNQPD